MVGVGSVVSVMELFRIHTPPHKPTKKRTLFPFRISQLYLPKETNANGVNEQSENCWDAPILLLTKNDDKKGYYEPISVLNVVTDKDAYTGPRIDEYLVLYRHQLVLEHQLFLEHQLILEHHLVLEHQLVLDIRSDVGKNFI
ncbi:hypothetical protein CHS0354_020342 [Potamilus streckersoni]|uniref:Uncharacterized protein n=1 Tax=Potamilus streckersoni TaxID=2493646 RepID=A0AAE0SFZ0_9BIVA|nr:hypothetical protein CHS0354_020342 [Potamilus streckersoni]